MKKINVEVTFKEERQMKEFMKMLMKMANHNHKR